MKSLVLPRENVVSNQIIFGILYTSARNCLVTTNSKKVKNLKNKLVGGVYLVCLYYEIKLVVGFL